MKNPKKEILSDQVGRRLAHRRYDSIYSDWEKAINRLDDDQEGAITAARAFLESTCKLVLDELNISYENDWDLPKLYHATSTQLGLSPVQHTDLIFRSFFGSTQTIVNRIGELRNKLGDAHGKGHLRLALPRHHTELAVNLAGSISCFLVSCLESTLAAKKLLTSDGKVTLRFDLPTVWRLVDHSGNSPHSLPSYSRKTPKRVLWLVGDAGVYLMSNGSPAIDYRGRLITKDSKTGIRRLTSPALGCDPSYNSFEDWWAIHNAIDGGNDFSIPISIKQFKDVLPACKSHVVILINAEMYEVMSDIEFEKKYGVN
jgi:hypothetical protein